MPRAHAKRRAAIAGAPPAVSPDTLRRPRLEERLDGAFGKRLTLVVAGPGYGKSTLLACWCSDVATAWHSLSERDTSLTRLARGLGACLSPWLPEPPPVGAAVRSSGTSMQQRERADSYAAALSEALGRSLTHDLVLVLEDAHEVASAPGATQLLESLCKQAPPLVHVVLSSRERIPFRIERLRGRGDVLELESGDLGFTLEEVGSLARLVGVPLAEASARRVCERTGGWPAAVRLVLETLRDVANERTLTATLERLVRPEGALYSYLAEEVFGQIDSGGRELLRRSTPFDRVTPALCEALGCPEPDALRDLARRGLAAELPEDWFTVHALVRDFVARTSPLSAGESRDLNLRAASWLEASGHLEEALRALAAAGDRAGIADLLSRRGSELLIRGGAETVVQYGEAVDAGALDTSAEEVLGEAYTVLGDHDRALAHLRRAAGDARTLHASVAWRMVAAYHLADDLEAASAVRLRTQLRGAATFDRALLLAWSVGVERRLGNHVEAARLARRALAAAEESRDDRARALAYTASALASEGDDRDPLPDLEHALAAAERAGDTFQLARIRNNRGSILLESGDYGRAIEELNAALQLAELGGFTTLVALATMNRGLCHFCLGRLDEAGADYGAAAALYRRTGSRELAYALVGSGDVHRERGDLALARAGYEEGLSLGERSGDRQALVPALYQLAKVIVDDEPDQALRMAERAIAYGWPDQAWALNSYGWVALARGDREAAADAADRAAAAAREQQDPFGLAESLELAACSTRRAGDVPRLLADAISIWRRCGNAVHQAAGELALARLSSEPQAHRAERRAEARLRSLGVRASATGPAGLLRFVAEPRDAPIVVETLGGFRVLRDGTPVPRASWQSQKARDLLKILVSRRGAATPREVLMEALWSGDDPSKLGNRLSVALSTVHSVLDPGREHAPNRFVWSDRRAVGIDLSQVVVDVEEFLAEASEGLELRASGHEGAQERLEHAFALYRGDFLEGDAYEEWATSLREQARSLYLDVAHALADEATSADRHDEAARYSLRILDRDAYDERAHLRLVSSLVRSRRHGEGRRRYGLYCRRMQEIGVEAAPFPGGASQQAERTPLIRP